MPRTSVLQEKRASAAKGTDTVIVTTDDDSEQVMDENVGVELVFGKDAPEIEMIPSNSKVEM